MEGAREPPLPGGGVARMVRVRFGARVRGRVRVGVGVGVRVGVRVRVRGSW